MLLQKIKIKGFKSFPDSIELELEKGITGIVGPNGCGKSNIADSINWALGEQSPTSLRGKRMEQMIFNGSSNRKAMGAAEVTLVLSANGKLPKLHDGPEEEQELLRQGSGLPDLLSLGENGELSVTRRMFRDTQSEYLLNGKPCRLRDIQDLLMALGIGSRVVTIVEQDRINVILNSRPVDRRELIEDAAGITKFKLNKHLTKLKLERTGQNLMRIEDLLAEQEVHLRSLRRQAARARRFRRYQAEIREIETSLLAVRHFELSEQHRESSRRLRSLEEDLAGSSAKLSSAESAQAELRQRVDELIANQVNTREKHYQSSLEIDRDNNRLKHLREGLDSLFRRREQATARHQEAQKRYKSKRLNLDDAKRQVEELDKELISAQVRLKELKKKADLAGSDVDSLRSEKERLQSELAEKREKLAAEKSRRESLRAEEQRLATASVNAAALKDKLRGKISEVDDTISQTNQRIAELDERLLQTDGELQRGIDDRKALEREIEAHDRRAESIKGSHGSAAATLDALLEMEKRREGVADSTRALFDNEDIRNAVKPLGLIADSFDIDPARIKAVIAAFGRILEAVLVEDESAAELGLKMLRKQEIGHASFVPLSRIPEAPAANIPEDDLRAGLGPRGDLGKRLLSLFEPARLASDTHQAIEISAGGEVAVAATNEGTAARNGRLIRGGSDTSREEAFTRRTRIDDVRKQAESLEKELEKLSAARAEFCSRRDDIDSTINELRETREKLRLEKAGLSAQARADIAERERLEDSQVDKNREIESLKGQLTDVAAEIENETDVLAGVESEIEAVSSALQNFDERLQQSSEAAGDARHRESQLLAEISALEERCTAGRRAAELIESNLTDLLERIASSQDEIKMIEEERVNNLHEIESIETGMQEKIEANEALKRSLSEIDGRLMELNSALKLREAEVKRLRAEHAEIQEKLERIRLESQEHLLELEHLRERAASTLQIDPEELADSGAPAVAAGETDESFDSQEAQQRLQDLKDKVEQMGAVNLLASEEYERHQQRHRFLLDQRQDIVDSIASLERVINRIDRVSRKRFREAFDRINENFHKTFRKLFGGGRAELQLEEGDLLEAGIEILVQPPGKRLQSATLLSGGEKSISAFALIMAVLQFRPSPFCILDEADAALDEVNTRRIANLLRDYSHSTQFILITHNKTTMEVADRLYGVTMEEPGVSKLVSVKFN
ncbi:MAG TPA: chromosome segregation protein SMC [Acidobacteriota bacterium]|nr:chromosome segregation protein SMC [Acidobacteriota bacterium]